MSEVEARPDELAGFRPRQTSLVKDMYSTPYGTFEHTPWYGYPAKPEGNILLESTGGLIRQIDEPIGGKQSCTLTAQLNALILRDAITTDEASYLQTVLGGEKRFDRLWHNQEIVEGKPYQLWRSRPGDTAYVAYQLLGKRIDFRLEEPSHEEMLAHLRDGYIAVIYDDVHARTAFMPQDSNLFYVFDSKYDELTDFYDANGLTELRTQNQVVLF